MGAGGAGDLGVHVLGHNVIADLTQLQFYNSLDVIGLLRVLSTTSNMIEWLRQTTRITGATAVGEFADTAETTLGKPEGTAVWERVQSPVTTIAVHVAVNNQQLDDAPEIRTVIDEDLRFEIE